MSYKDESYKEHKETYQNVAKDFKGKVLFVTIDTDDDDHEKIMEFFGLKKEEAPAMRLIKLEDEMTKFKPEKTDFTESYIREFVNGVLEGKIKVISTRSFVFFQLKVFFFFLATPSVTRSARRLGQKSSESLSEHQL